MPPHPHARAVRFALEDNDQLVAARDQAFADARARARQYAELAGRELGALVSISGTMATPPPAPQPHYEALSRLEQGVPLIARAAGDHRAVTAVWSLVG